MEHKVLNRKLIRSIPLNERIIIEYGAPIADATRDQALLAYINLDAEDRKNMISIFRELYKKSISP